MGTETLAMQSREEPSLVDALFTVTQQRLLGLLYGQPERSFFVSELIALADVGRGAVQRELARLDHSGLVINERRGTQKHYRANPAAPIFDELCSIVSKTIGVPAQIREGLEPLANRISLAFIYGSTAKQTDTAASDIDLLVVSDNLTLEDLFAHVSPVESQLGRSIHPTLYTQAEFDQRRTQGNTFLARVLGGPVTILQGTLDDA